MVVSNEVSSNVDDEMSVKSVGTAEKSVSAQSQASEKEIFTEEKANELKEIASDIVTKLTPSDSHLQPDQAAEEASLASKKSTKSTKSASSKFSIKSFGSKKSASSPKRTKKSLKSAEKSLQEGDVNDITKMKTAPSTVDEEGDESASDGEELDIIQERASRDEVEVALPPPKFEGTKSTKHSKFSLKSFGSKKSTSSTKRTKSVKSAEKSLEEGDVNEMTKTAPSTVDEEDNVQERASSDEVEVALPPPTIS